MELVIITTVVLGLVAWYNVDNRDETVTSIAIFKEVIRYITLGLLFTVKDGTRVAISTIKAEKGKYNLAVAQGRVAHVKAVADAKAEHSALSAEYITPFVNNKERTARVCNKRAEQLISRNTAAAEL